MTAPITVQESSAPTTDNSADSSVSESECSGSGTYRIAQAHQQHEVAGTRNGHGCNPRRAARDDSSARSILGDRV